MIVLIQKSRKIFSRVKAYSIIVSFCYFQLICFICSVISFFIMV